MIHGSLHNNTKTVYPDGNPPNFASEKYLYFESIFSDNKTHKEEWGGYYYKRIQKQ